MPKRLLRLKRRCLRRKPSEDPSGGGVTGLFLGTGCTLMSKIYTKAGDAGNASIKNQRLSKGALVFDLLGDLDELSSRLGELPPFALRKEIQSALLSLGGDVAGYGAFATDLLERLERQIDFMMSRGGRNDEAFEFVQPRGRVHVARTVCRRAERELVRFAPNHSGLPFLNRLSDFLFALAEYGNVQMRTVLVTGGARRIGRAIACELAARGWCVIVHARRTDDADAKALAEELGGKFIAGDLAEPLAAPRLFQSVCELAPNISAIVNNAAVFSTVESLPAEAEAALKMVNCEVPEKLTTLLGLRLMEHSPYQGAVVNLLDTRIIKYLQFGQTSGERGQTPYERSKCALYASMLKSAGLFASCLRVNAVSPGPVLLPTNDDCRESAGELLLDHRPTPRDVAEAVAYLLEAKSVTGQNLAVDSGQSMCQ